VTVGCWGRGCGGGGGGACGDGRVGDLSIHRRIRPLLHRIGKKLVATDESEARKACFGRTLQFPHKTVRRILGEIRHKSAPNNPSDSDERLECEAKDIGQIVGHFCAVCSQSARSRPRRRPCRSTWCGTWCGTCQIYRFTSKDVSDGIAGFHRLRDCGAS
jgi:hypothetical protein